MLRILIITLLFILSFSLIAETNYLVVTDKRDLVKDIDGYTKTVFNKGRIRLVVMKKRVAFRQLPPKVRRVLREIDPKSVKVYTPPQSFIQTKEPAFEKIMAKISKLRLEKNLAHIVQGYKSRAIGAPGNKEAHKWLTGEFKKLGLETSKHCFSSYWGRKGCNVLGLQKVAGARSTIVVMGHFDTVGKAFAGADDNGSGTIGVLEMAHVLKGVMKNHNVIYFGTDGEESGLLGSKAYVKKLKSDGMLKKIRHAVNMDMIGYNSSGIIELGTDKKFKSDAELLSSLVNTYTSYTPRISMPTWGSDHVPFIKAGVSSILSIEDWDDHNPCYHQTCDTLDKIDYNFMKAIIRANVAMVMTLDK